MLRKSLRRRLLGASLAVSIPFAAAGTASAVTVVRDQFSDLGLTDGADSKDVPWSVLNSSLVTIGLTDFGGTEYGKSIALNSSWAGTGNHPLVRGGTFVSTPLAIGEYISLVAIFKITTAAPIPSEAAAIRFGLGSSAATYTFRFGSGTTPGAGLSVTAPNLLTGTATNLTITGSAPVAINNSGTYGVTIRLRRVDATTLEVVGRVGSARYVATHTGVTNFTFDRILLGTGAVNNLDMKFDDIFVVTATPTPASPRIGLTSGDEASKHVEDFLGKMQVAGARNLRTFPGWSGLEPTNDSYSWGFWDGRIQLIEAYGMQTSGLFVYASAWSGGGKVFPTSATEIANYGSFAGVAASRYGSRIANWEVWNEPNSEDFNTAKYGPAQYAALVKSAYNAVKAVSPTTRVGLTVANFDVRFLKLTIESLAAQGAAGKFDFLGIHPYGLAARMNGVDGQGERYFLNMVPFLRSLPGCSTIPVRITEIGAKADGATLAEGELIGEDLQAETLAKVYALSIASGVEHTQWFEARAAGGSVGWGLLTSSGVETKSYKAYCAVISALGSNPTYKGWLSYGTGGIGYGFVFGGATSDVLIAWMPKGKSQLITFPGAVNVVDIFTNVTTPLASGSSLNLGDKPVIVRNLPASTVSTASSNKALPFPWGSVPATSNLVDLKFGATNVGRGMTQGNPGETPNHTFSDGSEGRKMNNWGVNNEFSFNIDPRFATYGTRDVYVRVTARRITLDTTAKLALNYEPSGTTNMNALGFPRNTTNEWNLPNDNSWHTYTWHITDALIANTFGRSMYFSAGNSSVFVIGKVEVSKVPF